MADFVKFSELSSLSAVEASALIPIVQDGDNFTTSLSSLQNSLTLNSSDIGDATSIATPDTIALRDSSGSVSFTSLTASDVVNIGNQITFQSGAAAAATRTNLGLGTGDSPTFLGVSLGPNGSNVIATFGSATWRDEGSGQLSLNRIYYFSSGSLSLTNKSLAFGTVFGSSDTGLSRVGPRTIALGSSAIGSAIGTLILTNLTASGTVSAANLSLTNPLSLANGGTGGTDPSTARTNLGAGATGSTIFQAATVAAARETLNINDVFYNTLSDSPSRNNDTFADDDVLAGIPLVENGVYQIVFNIIIAATASSGFKLKFVTSNGALALNARGFVINANNASSVLVWSANTGETGVITRTAATVSYDYHGIITIKASANCNMALQWAQNTLDAAQTATRLAGSFISVRKLN